MQAMGYKVCEDKSLMQYFFRYSHDPGNLYGIIGPLLYDYGTGLKDIYLQRNLYWKVCFQFNKWSII